MKIKNKHTAPLHFPDGVTLNPGQEGDIDASKVAPGLLNAWVRGGLIEADGVDGSDTRHGPAEPISVEPVVDEHKRRPR